MIKSKMVRTVAVMAVLLLTAVAARSRTQEQAVFRYVAGTESMTKGCEGKLEVTQTNLVFLCGDQSLTIPYGAITEMEFQPQISKKIRKMKLAWAIKPTSARSKHQGFFSVLYSQQGKTRAIVLRTRDEDMRPYLAEIDLKTGRPIESRQD